MGTFLTKLFDTSDFPARWQCGTWTAFEGWLHVLSDLSIFAAYTAIPLVIMYYRQRRKDMPFGPLYWMFCLFIFSCGATHLLEAVIFWEPVYRLSGVVKAVTAVASTVTVIALVRLAPQALSLPGQAALGRRLADEVDIRRRREQELEYRNAELDQFASVASHDLREPLRKIRFFTEQIRHDQDNQLSPESLEAMAVVGSAVERSQQLIHGLLEFARVGRESVRAEVVDLRRICENLRDELAITDPGIRFEITGDRPSVQGDPRLLAQLMENLVTNSIKYRSSEREPYVGIDLAGDEQGQVVVTVRDNGIGFDQTQVDRIFLPFERLHGRDRYPGVGMGLAICRRIAEAHGGSLTGEGVVDQGAIFRLKLKKAATRD